MLQRYCLVLVLLAAWCCSGTAQAAEKYATVKITIENASDQAKVRNLALDPVSFGDGYAEAIVSEYDIHRLQAAGLKFASLIPDMTAYYQNRLDKTKMMGGYRGLAEIGLAIDSIAAEHPDIVTPVTSIGTTIQGRPIWMLKISDNPNVDEDEPEVLYDACHHAREVITPELLIYFMRYLTNNYGTDPQVTELVNSRELYFVPCVNPDGYYYNEEQTPEGGGMWRKNMRPNGDGSFGIDLNRNYSYEWGYDNTGSSPDPSSDVFRGTAPFSEPETQAMRDFIIARNFKLIVSYHSAAGLILSPWGFARGTTADDGIFSEIGDTVNAMTWYTAGPCWRVLYTCNGGAFDWEYGDQTMKPKILAISPEVGNYYDGFWPPSDRITPLVQQHLQPNLFYARAAGSLEQLLPPPAPVVHDMGIVDTSYFHLYWHHADPQNPAVSYEVWQMQNLQRTSDDLEGGGTGWKESGFSLSASQAHSGTHSYFSGSAAISDTKLGFANPVRVRATDTLTFWTRYTMNQYMEFGYVEVSMDGGNAWEPIPGNITTTTNPYRVSHGYGLTGTTSGWTFAKYPLGAFAGQEIMLRFRYVSQEYPPPGGWYIDDISPIEFFQSATKLASANTDTTIFVQNLQVGDYEFRIKARDAQGQMSPFSPRLTTQVRYKTCTWLVADADNSGSIDISDAVYLISYIFTGGPAPVPDAVGSGDADCSMSIDISDAVYLIAYIFSGGPAPGATCDCSNYR
jgi:hypothetical protein